MQATQAMPCLADHLCRSAATPGVIAVEVEESGGGGTAVFQSQHMIAHRGMTSP